MQRYPQSNGDCFVRLDLWLYDVSLTLETTIDSNLVSSSCRVGKSPPDALNHYRGGDGRPTVGQLRP